MEKDKLEKIYNLVADMTIKRIEREKETTLSETTFRMISLTQRLHNSMYFHTGAPDLLSFVLGAATPVSTLYGLER